LRATIGLAFVVDVNGKPCDIDVLSPSEFSVGEAAVKALKQWQFTPATKARLPVRTQTYAQFNFITNPDVLDQKESRQFDLVYRGVHSSDPNLRRKSIEEMVNLEKHKFPMAIAVRANLRSKGKGVPKDEVAALKALQGLNLEKAHFGYYALGLLYEEGIAVPRDEAKAIQLYTAGAFRGNQSAQIQLANVYLKKGLRAEAIRLFRLCGIENVGCEAKANQLIAEEPSTR